MKKNHICIQKRLLAVLLVCALISGILPSWTVSAQQDVSGAGFGLSNPVVDNGVTTWDCIYFGNYWQNDTNGDGRADDSDDKQPIKWRVLSVDGDDVFLLSDRNLSRQVYKSLSDKKGVKWETSTIRSWLNGYNGEANICGEDYTEDNFLDDAFDDSEQAAIKNTLVVNTDNSSAFPDNGNDTTDKVYLLSVPEVMKASYGFVSTWNKTNTREAKNTAYIDAGESKGDWWLRTLGEVSSFGDKACHIDGEGRLWRVNEESYVSDLSHTVRPALHLNLAALDSTSNSVWSYAGKITSDGREIEAELEIGVTEVNLSDTGKTLKIGEKYQIEATVLPSNATDKTLTYKSSDDSVVSVSVAGEVEAKKAGTVTVTVMSVNGKLAQLQVTVEKVEEPEIPGDVESSIAVTEVNLSDTGKMLKIGEKYQIKATVLPSNATDKTLTYKSSDDSVVSVSAAGEAEAKKAGTVTVTVMSVNGKLAQLQVTVEEEPKTPGDLESSVDVIEIKLSDTDKTLKIGEKYQIKATVLPSNATDKTLTYKSSDDSVVSVSAAGEVEAKKAGTAIVMVMSANGRRSKMQVTVGEEAEEPEEPKIPEDFESSVEVTEVKISDTGKTLEIGEKYRIEATVLPLNATDKTLTYKSSDDLVASVSDDGEVEAKKAGTVMVTVMSANGKMAQMQVTVEEMEKKTEVQKVLVSANKMTVGVGEKVQLEAAVYPGDAFSKALTYKASNNKVKVNKKGVLTARKTGSCKITISSSNNKSVVVKVTVKKKPTEIRLNAKKKTLKVGKKFQIKTKLPNDTASYKITYTSNKESVAVVSQTGKVTAMKKGDAIITVKTYNGKKAILKLHVK